MLQAVCDESGGDNDGIFVMAGYVATVENWLKFSDQWKNILELQERPHRPIDCFKMSRLTHPRGLRRAEKFYRVIEANAIAAFSVRINIAEMKQAMIRAQWPVELVELHSMSKPYYFAFRMITEGLAKVQSNLGVDEPVDFVFDDHTSKGFCVRGWEDFKLKAPPEWSRYLGCCPIFRPDDKYLPLQAADLYAWWVRKWALEGKDFEGVESQNFAWNATRALPRFHWVFKEDDFVAEYEEELAGLKAMFPGDAEALSEAVTAQFWNP